MSTDKKEKYVNKFAARAKAARESVNGPAAKNPKDKKEIGKKED